MSDKSTEPSVSGKQREEVAWMCKHPWGLIEFAKSRDHTEKYKAKGWTITPLYSDQSEQVEELKAFIKHVGASSFSEARDVIFRSLEQCEDRSEKQFNQIKEMGKQLAAIKAENERLSTGLQQAIDTLKNIADDKGGISVCPSAYTFIDCLLEALKPIGTGGEG